MKNSILYLFIFLFAGIASVFAQAPDTMWTRTYGGYDSDIGHSVQETSDGGYIIVGTKSLIGANNRDIYLIKTDANGDTLFTKTFGGSGDDVGSSVLLSSDGGYIITGWTKPFVAGYSDVYLIKTDANGNFLFSKTIGGSDDDYGKSLQQANDGGYVIVGTTRSFGAGNGDVYLIKTDANGVTLFTKTFGGIDSEWGNSIQQTNDGGYIIVGQTESFGEGYDDIYMIKTDGNGDTVFTKTFGGIAEEYGASIEQTNDGNYIIVGTTYSFGAGGGDIYLIKTDANGDTMFTRTFGGSSYDDVSAICQINDGSYVIAGTTVSFSTTYCDIYLNKIDENGNLLWWKTFGGIYEDQATDIKHTGDGGYIIVGLSNSFHGANNYDVYLIKLAPEQVAVKEENNLTGTFSLAQNYPNPFNPQTAIGFSLLAVGNVTLKVYDLLGQEVATLINNQIMQAGKHEVQFDGSNLQSGVYYYRLQAGTFTETKKLVLMK